MTSCRHKNEHVKVTKGPLSVEELMSAEEFWIKKAQAQAYSDDLTLLAAGKEVHCSSDLRSLYPYTDEKGILRVGGRLKQAPIPYQAKHPAILPKKHDIVPLILLHLHQKQNHSGVVFWPAVSQREKINCKALWLPVHLPCDKSSTPRNCTLTRGYDYGYVADCPLASGLYQNRTKSPTD